MLKFSSRKNLPATSLPKITSRALKTKEEKHMATQSESSKWFLSNYNNGVIAVVSEEHARLGDDHPDFRVFTFCSDETFAHPPEARLYYTGNYTDLEKIQRASGIHIRSISDSGRASTWKWTGFVPYSNQEQYATDRDDDFRHSVLRWKTTLADAVRAFGVEALAALA